MKFVSDNIFEIHQGLSEKKVFRKSQNEISKIIIDFSNDEKEFTNFLKVYQILKKINISIPKIYEVYFTKKIIIMEDFGINTFDKIYKEEKIYKLLRIAIDNLIIIENSLIYKDLEQLEKYTFNDLKKEISEFINFYIPYKKISNFPINDFYDSWFRVYNNEKFDFTSFVHKDFEFINLILVNKNLSHLKCGIIDFQSAFIGFKGWDLFSILENPRLNFTSKYNDDLIKYYYQNTNITTNYEKFLKQYYILNLARQTRLIGRWVKLLSLGNKQSSDYINITKKRIIFCLSKITDKKLKQLYEKVFIN